MALNDAITYLSFDNGSGDATDSSGNGRTFTNTNTVTYVTGKVGAFATNYVRASNQNMQRSNLAVYNPSSGTINCWIKPSSDTGANVYTIWSSSTGVGTAGIEFRLNNNMVLDMYFGADAFEVTGATALSPGTWYMATVTWNTSRKEIFLNATSDGANETDQTLVGGSLTVYIGSRGGSAEALDADLDEFGFWDRVLSGAEITELYNGGAGKNPYAATGPATLESWNTVAKANIETMDTVALANIETWNTVV